MILHFHRVLIALVFYQVVIADPSAEEAAKYRLKTDVIPKNYKLNLLLDNSTFQTNSYSGNVVITVDIQSGNQTEIKLHAKGLKIDKATIANGKNAAVAAKSISAIDKDTDIFAITFDSVLSKGEYQLAISFTGELATKDMDGFYKSTYKNYRGEEESLATTQFEATSARKAFPCFDEPALKATFDLTITYPKGYLAKSNNAALGNATTGPLPGLETLTFKTTPTMSTYLLAFIVSKFECTALMMHGSWNIETCARRGERRHIDMVRDIAYNILNEMRDFTGYDYRRSDLDKLTLAAIPGFAGGAMENWGLITFKEVGLLWDANESSDLYHSKMIALIAHEIAHQWFGDLVTLKWWSDIFLNEGFATYFQYFAASQAESYKEYEFDKRFVIEELQPGLAEDIDADHKPLHFNVNKPEDISGRFDSVSYNKGASVLRMFQHMTGISTFKAGLRNYIAVNQNQNTEPSEFWDAYDSANLAALNNPAPIATIMKEWTNQKGYPLVKVSLDDKTVTLSQSRFPPDQTGDYTNWSIPISYTLPTEVKLNTVPRKWLAGNSSLSFDLPAEDDFLLVNVQQTGFYRVDYDNNLWNQISNYLKSNMSKYVDQLNRAQITDDLFSMAKVGMRNYSDTLRLLQFLSVDDSFYTWTAATNGFDYLLRRVSNDAVVDALTTRITNDFTFFLHNARLNSTNDIDSVLEIGSFMDLQKLNLGLTWSCRLNNKVCVNYANEKFKNFLANTTDKPDRNIRDIVYCNALRNSKNITNDWEFLWKRFQTTTLATEQITILKSLGCSIDSNTIERYLTLATDRNSSIRIQDAPIAFTSSYQSVENVDVVLDFIVKNSNRIKERFNGSNRNLISFIRGIADRLFNSDQVEKLQDFGTNSTDPDVKKAVLSATEEANKNLKLTVTFNADLSRYFARRVSNSAMTLNLVHFLAFLPAISLFIAMCYQ